MEEDLPEGAARLSRREPPVTGYDLANTYMHTKYRRNVFDLIAALFDAYSSADDWARLWNSVLLLTVANEPTRCADITRALCAAHISTSDDEKMSMGQVRDLNVPLHFVRILLTI